jgi:hypothetical protein
VDFSEITYCDVSKPPTEKNKGTGFLLPPSTTRQTR